MQHKHHQQHNTVLAHKHKSETRRPNTFAIMSAEVADQPLIEIIDVFEKTARQSGMLDLIYQTREAYQIRVANQQEIDRSMAQETAQEFDFGQLAEDFLNEYQLNKVFELYLEFTAKKYDKLLLDYLKTIEDPITDSIRLMAIKRSQSIKNPMQFVELEEKKRGSWRHRYGKCKESFQILRKKEKKSKKFAEIRATIANNCLPLGLGYSSIPEYHLFLVQHLFLDGNPYYEQGDDNQDYHSFNIKAKYDKKLGHEARLLWQILQDKLTISLQQYEKQGILAKKPRSRKALMQKYVCSEAVATAVIDVYAALPENPANDIVQISYFSRQIKKQKNYRETEMEIYWDESRQCYYPQWVDTMAEKITILEHDVTKKLIAQMETLSSIKLTHKELKKAVIKNADIRKLTYQLLKDKLSEKILDEKALDQMIEHYLALPDNSIANESQKDDFQALQAQLDKKTKSLRVLKTIYDNFLKAIADKPKIIDFIINFQQEYLKSGHPIDLKPLTKTMVVEALGFLSSSRYNKADTDLERKKSAIIGRRLERYMKHTVIRYQGACLPLDDLIPGKAGVKQFSGQHQTKIAVMEMIKELIDEENKQKPLSDQKISLRLKEDYGIKIARETVKKYRLELGFLSSQGRVVV